MATPRLKIRVRRSYGVWDKYSTMSVVYTLYLNLIGKIRVQHPCQSLTDCPNDEISDLIDGRRSSLSLNSKQSGILSPRLVSTGLGDVRDVGHSILLVTNPTNAKELNLVLGTEQLKVTYFRYCGKYYSENRNH